MRNLGVFILAIVVLGCSAEPEPAQSAAADPETNRPPVIQDISLAPRLPSAGQDVSVSVKVTDPDRDPLQMEFEWYLNGTSQGRGLASRLSGGQLSRGDRLYAVVRISDGHNEIMGRTPEAQIQNQAPVVTNVTIHPSQATTRDELVAAVDTTDRDGDSVELRYRWYVNGNLVDGADAASFEPGRARRGDLVSVAVLASDRQNESEWVDAKSQAVSNAPPDISSEPLYELADENVYRYQVVAKDPDGDRPLRYTLIAGPEGMSMDLVGGNLTWTVPRDVGGIFPIELSVTDGHGGETRQRYSLELRWEAVPASGN